MSIIESKSLFKRGPRDTADIRHTLDSENHSQ